VQANSALRPLLETNAYLDGFYSHEEGVESRQEYGEIECSDLPYIFRTTLSSIPRELDLPGCHRSKRTPPKELKRIGVVWASGAWNPARSISIDVLLPTLTAPGREVFSLQRDTSSREPYNRLPSGLLNAESAVPNLLTTAKTLESLDLLITVDTMAAHLAGCLRTPVWTLLTFDSDWRWMLAGDTTPWYESMRLFRQPVAGDWNSVIQNVSRALKET
jgi:hypothetical protein